MIDPQARPISYIRLMALVAILGVVSAGVTFGFMALVHEGIILVWEQAAQVMGIDPRLFTLLVCTLGGLLVGLLVKLFGDHSWHLCRSDARIRQHRALRLPQRTRDRGHGPGVAHLWRQSGAGSAAGRCLRWDRDLGCGQAQAR